MNQALALRASASARVWTGLFLAIGLSLSLAAVAVAPMLSTAIGQAAPTLRGPAPALPHPTDGVQPFYLNAANPAEADRAVRCLTDAIYYEAANEPEEGQRAVAQVVVNRIRDDHFPKSVCGVVYEGWQRTTGCQFSFVCDGSITRRHADPVVWNRLRPLAEQALNGYVVSEVGTSTHYYATYVKPNWVRTVAQVAEIGKHIFCSWKGKAGLPTALSETYQGGEFLVAQAALDGARLREAVRHVHLGRHHG
jgi:hypothetical protein